MTDVMFLGNALNAVDAKNRLSVPASFREVIANRSDARAVVLSLHERANCLVGYGRDRPAKVEADLDARFAGDWSAARDNQFRTAMGTVEVVPIEDTGRIVLPPVLKDLAEIDRLALFVGMGQFFEVWNPHLFLDLPDLDPRVIRMVRRLLDLKAPA